MSFKFNSAEQIHHEKSWIMTHDNQLMAPSIGITGNRRSVSFKFNKDSKQFKYFKTDEEKLSTFNILDMKLKRYAFRQIQKKTHFYKEYTNTVFLPQALQNGDDTVVTKFLERLKNNRIDGYIKMHLQQSKGYFMKAGSLISAIRRIFQKRFRNAFSKINVKHNESKQFTQNKTILKDLDLMSSIDNKQSERNSLASSKKRKLSNFKLEYTLVKLDSKPQQWPKSSRQSQSMNNSKQYQHNIEQINIGQLIKRSKVRQYTFQLKKDNKMYLSRNKQANSSHQ